jgi:hypothetical protein
MNADDYPLTKKMIDSIPVFTEEQKELIKSLQETIENLKKDLAFKNWSEYKEV